jgi:O-acetyl-ADP-ribose deacetylase (regulator of RNase III)
MTSDPARERRIEVIVADITTLEVDAIVNAANERMLGGGGVDGAIHAAAGPELLAACRLVPEVRRDVRCPTGEARITPGFRLAAKWIIHTVGPIYAGGRSREPELLASCYRASLDLAARHGVRSIAFPAISTGVYGYPKDEAAAIAARECRVAIAALRVERVVLCAFREADSRILRLAVDSR